MSKRNASGFTLVEMFVVIGICLLLAGLLFPMLMRSRDDARSVVCASNLGRLGGVMNTILPVRSGYFDNAYYNVTRLQEGKWWVGLHGQYDGPDALLDPDLQPAFQCPAARGYVNLAAGNGATFSTTYAHNVEMPIIASNIARVPEPANRVILYDGDPSSVVGIWEHNFDWPNRTIIRRHSGAANFLFLDGHVERRSEFRAEPFHGCQLKGDEGLDQPDMNDERELPGRSEWVLLADIDLHPESNNIKNNGNTIQCKITLAPGASELINTDTIYLVGAAGEEFKQPLPAISPISQSLGSDGSVVCQLKFDRQQLYSQLTAGEYFGRAVPMKVVGELRDGRPFEGIDANCVFNPPNK